MCKQKRAVRLHLRTTSSRQCHARHTITLPPDDAGTLLCFLSGPGQTRAMRSIGFRPRPLETGSTAMRRGQLYALNHACSRRPSTICCPLYPCASASPLRSTRLSKFAPCPCSLPILRDRADHARVASSHRDPSWRTAVLFLVINLVFSDHSRSYLGSGEPSWLLFP